MKYFIDTEFHEYHKQPKVCGIKIGKPIPTIDLISIGIVSEDADKTLMKPYDVYSETVKTHREYYAISKDFNIKDAWDSFQIEMPSGDMRNHYPNGIKVHWLRENVLKPIYFDLLRKYEYKSFAHSRGEYERVTMFEFERVINKYGKTNKQIAEEIKTFVYYTGWEADPPVHHHKLKEKGDVNFYAFYADYDWVVFAQLFGKMIDLPKGFPMYCKDLIQESDRIYPNRTYTPLDETTPRNIRKHPKYPKQENKHNALDDAKWNKKLYEFLKTI